MVDTDYFKSPSAACKIAELVFLVIIMATFFSDAGCLVFLRANMGSGAALFVSSTVVPCFLNAILLLITYAMGYTQLLETPLELMLYVYYTLATFSSSIILMASGNSPFIASGVFTLFLFLVYVAEVYFSYMRLTSRPTSFPSTFQAPTPADAPSNPAYTMPSSFAPAPTPSSFAPPPYYPPDNATQAPTAAPAAAGGTPTVTPPTSTTTPDTVDTSQTSKSLYTTNPSYPEALNYPPKDVHPYF